YSVFERNYTIEALQPQGLNPYAAFFAHPRETVDYHYERKLYDRGAGATAADPRVTHQLTLAVDFFGNVLRSASIGYGRRYPDTALAATDQLKQRTLLGTYAQDSYTNAVLEDDAYRVPAIAEANTYELLQIAPASHIAGTTNLFRFDEMQAAIAGAGDGSHDVPYEDLNASGLNAGEPYRRLIECTRTYYRPKDMGAAAGDPRALLALGTLDERALSGTVYQLAFTPGLIAKIYQRGGTALLPTPTTVLGSLAGDGGGYADLDSDGRFWISSGRTFYQAAPPASPAELNNALQHFFLTRRFEDAFGNATTISYDAYDLLIAQTTDARGNVSSASNDYRVLAAALLTDANGNQTAASFDALGLVVATAVMGKTGQNEGDTLSGFTADLPLAQIDAFHNAADPHTLAAPLLGNATSRIVYDVNKFYHTRQGAPGDPTQWLPAFAATIVRETHVSDLAQGDASKLQISFSYSDGFGREIQKKMQAEPGVVVHGGPVVDPRWAGTGWTIFNNKGKPVRQYEPFFSQLTRGHRYEFGAVAGVSPILCYDPMLRVVATIHPNHSYEKVVFDPWGQALWDVNDTVLEDDPTTDLDVGSFFKLLPAADYSPTWRVQRAGGALGPAEQEAATKAAAHASTPTLAYFDTLGRTFLTIADNAVAGKYETRTDVDIQDYRRGVTDALGRKVMAYDYNLPGRQLHQASMDAGEQWLLEDGAGKAIRGWDSRGHNTRSEYDALRRPLNLYVLGTDAVHSDPRTTGGEVLFSKIEYGEGQANDQKLNLRTRIFQHFDTAGIVTNQATDPLTTQTIAFDFKGNLLGSSRQFAADEKALPDWSKAAPALLADVFVTTTKYDALNRVIAARTPDASTYVPAYNEANLLESISVTLRGAATATSFVGNIDYNAKGQRVLIEYGDGGASPATTAYTYDPLTFRLQRLTTTRPGFPANAQTVQDLAYTYDPVGNVTHIQDNADQQNVVFFQNRRVEPSGDYTYDAIYRLTQASGREQLGLNGGAPLAPAPASYNDVPRVLLP
ncbi:MAG: toxin, partial [Phycisphaerae bacterium]|nr:toxin [Phycisphaerae bacterium]